MRLPDRALVRLTGPDTIALLERTVTNSVKDWPAGELRYGALLTPQGKVIADYLAQRMEDGVLLDVHPDAAEDLMKRLKMFRLRSKVEIGPEPDLVPIRDETHRDPRSETLWGRRYAPSAGTDETLEAADWHAHRIAAGVPEWGADYGAAEVFPTDINMDVMAGVDYKKGCFVGQEVASRMKRRGKIRKRTLPVSGTGIVAGADIVAAAPIGTVTSVNGGRGLALVRTDRLHKAMADGGALTCNGEPVTVDLPGWAEAELATLDTETGDD